jgi:hypothetical protein
MVALASTSYVPISQEDGSENHPLGRDSQNSTISRPPIYYNDGEFSPPSSTDDLTTEKRSESHAFLDDDDYADDGIRLSGMESGGRVSQTMVKRFQSFSNRPNGIGRVLETNFSSQSARDSSRNSRVYFYIDWDFSRSDVYWCSRPDAR